MLLKRLKEAEEKEGGKKPKETDKDKKKERAICERIIDGIYTKGTYMQVSANLPNEISRKDESIPMLDYKFVLFFVHNTDTNEFGVSYFDLTTLKF